VVKFVELLPIKTCPPSGVVVKKGRSPFKNCCPIIEKDDDGGVVTVGCGSCFGAGPGADCGTGS